MKPQSTSTNSISNPTAFSSAQEEVQTVLSSLTDAFQQGDLERIMSFFADDFVGYDCMPPLQFTDKNQYREINQKYFTQSFRFPVVYEDRDMNLVVRDDVAFSYALVHFKGFFKETGKDIENWMRSTITLEKIDGKWLVVHMHNSVPIGEDHKALMNLDPDSTDGVPQSSLKH